MQNSKWEVIPFNFELNHFAFKIHKRSIIRIKKLLPLALF